MMNSYFLGREGFIWWMGVVEDRNDPDQLGRVRVRCFGWHTDDKASIPTDALPWAHSVHPNTVPSSYTPKEGDWVVGFFADGENAQQPVILGVLPGKPKTKPDNTLGFSDPNGVYPKRLNESTLNRLSRGRKDGTIHETRTRNLQKGIKTVGGSTWDEPDTTFSPQYPFNMAIESESGHALELDDTEGNERVHLAHKNGSYLDFQASGNRVQKIVGKGYSVVVEDDNVYIGGKCNVTIVGDANIKTMGSLNVEASKDINLSAGKDVRIRAAGKLMVEGNTVDVKGKGAVKVGGGGKLSLKGKSTAIQGSSVTLGGKVANKVKTKHGIGKILPTGSAASPSNTGLKDPS